MCTSQPDQPTKLPGQVRLAASHCVTRPHTPAIAGQRHILPSTTPYDLATRVMYSSKLTRVAHRATSAAANNSSATAHRSTSCLATSRSHQRRHSSSKASCPPDSSASGSKPAPDAKAGREKSPLDAPAQQRGQKRVSSKTSKKARTSAAAKSEDQFAGLPAVPGTQHINERGKLTYLSHSFIGLIRG